MLNKISVFDILACVLRKAKMIITLMIIFAVAFGSFRYFKNKSISDAAKERLSALEPAVNSADSDYSNYNEKIKNLPLFEINAKSTWVATAIYRITAAEMSDEEIEQYCKDLKLRWDSADLSTSLTDLFNKNPDDEEARSVIDFNVSDGKNLVLTIKAKNKPQCISVYYMINNLLSTEFSSLNKSQGYSGKLVQKKFEVKKTNDSDISQKQAEMKEKLQQLELIKNEKRDEYNSVAVYTDRSRGVKKWTVSGAVLALILVLGWVICRVCIYEPVVSAEQVNRDTGLEYIGTVKRKITLLDMISARISNERIKKTKVETQKFIDTVKKRIDGKELTLVTADCCSKEKDIEALINCLVENEYAVKSKTEDKLVQEIVRDYSAVLVVKKDRTTIKETKQLESMATDAGYKVEGFVFT